MGAPQAVSWAATLLLYQSQRSGAEAPNAPADVTISSDAATAISCLTLEFLQSTPVSAPYRSLLLNTRIFVVGSFAHL